MWFGNPKEYQKFPIGSWIKKEEKSAYCLTVASFIKHLEAFPLESSLILSREPNRNSVTNQKRDDEKSWVL